MEETKACFVAGKTGGIREDVFYPSWTDQEFHEFREKDKGELTTTAKFSRENYWVVPDEPWEEEE